MPAIDAAGVPDVVPARSVSTGDGGVQSFGLMRTGGKLLALRIDLLREVIACPAVLDPLPITAPGLCGAVRLRGHIIPVLDLQATLGEPPAEPPAEPPGASRGAAAPVIVLLRCDGRLLGLLVDAVQGMADVPEARLHATSCARPTGSDVVTHTFEVDDGVAMVLDAHRIAALPGVPMVDEPAPAPRDRVGGQREPMLLFRCGAVPLGIAASCVEATVPRSKLRHSALVDRTCRGVVDHHGHEVPVIDTLRVLGYGEAADASESALVVLHFPGGLLALMLDDVCDVVGVGAEDILPLTPLGLGAPHLLGGMLAASAAAAARGNHLIIDHTALRQDEALATFASLSRPKAAASVQASTAAAAAGRAYLTYLVGVETASPLTQAVEIIDYPLVDVIALPGSLDATLGLFAHRGAAVPLVCLQSLLGRSAALDPASARVLIVESEGRRIGFVVQALCTIETASWETPPPPANAAGAARGVQPLIEVGQGDQRRTLPRLDLLQLAHALLGDAPRDRRSPAGPNDGAAATPATPAPVAADETLLVAS